MNRSFLLPLLLGLGLAALLATASCSDVCPAGQTSCGDENASTAGAAGSSAPTTCPQLEVLFDCLDAFCASASNPFCTCHKQGKDLSSSCVCVKSTLDPAEFCRAAELNGADAASFDCAAATDAVKTMCIGVQ